jgi:general stress protein 26
VADSEDRNDVEDLLWKELGKDRVAMLGVRSGEPAHFKAMTPYGDRDTGRIWFFTKRDNDLVTAARGAGTEALLVYQATDGKFQASLIGKLVEDFNEEKRDKYWTAPAAAYFPGGKDDPELTMLRLDLSDAEIWHSEAGPVRFAYEVAKANLTKTVPDMGSKTEVKF